MINEYWTKRFCKEDISKIENYEKAIADTTQVWHCHHRTEIWWHCSKKDLIENECYYNRKACELIFLTPSEHSRLHAVNRTKETRIKLSESKKGKTSPRKGVTLLEETRKKISESNKGKNKGKNTSIFYKAFQEHYGIARCDNIKLYRKEHYYYSCHGHFSWEVV